MIRKNIRFVPFKQKGQGSTWYMEALYNRKHKRQRRKKVARYRGNNGKSMSKNSVIPKNSEVAKTGSIITRKQVALNIEKSLV